MAVDDPSRTFEEAGADFAALAPLLWDPLGRAMVEHTAPRPGGRVLDACCGTGASALPAARAVGAAGHVDAVDLAGALLEHGRQAAADLPQLLFSLADVTAWKADTPYDLVQSAYGVFFLPDMDAACARLISLLGEGGRFAVQTWRHGALVDFARCLFEAVADERPLPDERPASVAASERINSVEKLGDWLTGLDLRDVRVAEIRFALPLTPELSWALVRGTGWRILLEGCDDATVRRIHDGLLTRLGQRDVTELDAGSLIGIGHRS